MPTLEWIGKDKVINHHLDVPYRVLDHQYTYLGDGKTGAEIADGNKIIRGGATIVFSVMVAVIVVKNRTAFKSAIKSSRIEEVLTNIIETRNNADPLISESVENEFDVVFNDDGKGEAGDLVCLKDIDDNTIKLCLVHCKGAIGDQN